MCLELSNKDQIRDEVVSNRLLLINSINKAERELHLFTRWVMEKKSQGDKNDDETKKKAL